MNRSVTPAPSVITVALASAVDEWKRVPAGTCGQLKGDAAAGAGRRLKLPKA